MPSALAVALRSATTHSAHLPEDHDRLHELFTLKMALCLEENNVPDELLINADHAGVMLLNTPGYGRASSSSAEVASISHSSSEKRQFTVLPAVALSGDVGPWQLILAGQTDACLPPQEIRDLYPGLYFSYSDNHWSNMATSKVFVYKMHEHLLVVRVRIDDPTAVMCLLIDCWKIWASHEFHVWVMDTFHGDIIVRYVDACMTSKEQPLDVQLQSDIKSVISHGCEDYLCGKIQEQLNYGIAPGAIRLDLSLSGLKAPWCGWVNAARENLVRRPAFVAQSFEKALIGAEKLRNPATVVEAQRAKREGRLGAVDEPPDVVDDDEEQHMMPNHEVDEHAAADSAAAEEAEDAEVGMATVDEIVEAWEVADDARAQAKDTTELSTPQRLLRVLCENKMGVAEMKTLLRERGEKQQLAREKKEGMQARL